MCIGIAYKTAMHIREYMQVPGMQYNTGTYPIRGVLGAYCMQKKPPFKFFAKRIVILLDCG